MAFASPSGEPDGLELDHAAIVAAARRFTTRADDRDDLVQELWLTRLRLHPDALPSLRLWLRRVARRALTRLRRREQGRAERERLVAAREAVPSTLDEVERRCARERVIVLVDELEEPYRSAVRLRYLEELGVDQIAMRRGCLPGTVRSQVKRGLERLRERRSALEGHVPRFSAGA